MLPSLKNLNTDALSDEGSLVLFDPKKRYSQEQISVLFSKARKFDPELKGNTGEIRKLEVLRKGEDGIEPEPFLLAIKRMLNSYGSNRSEEILNESENHLKLYRKVSALDDEGKCKGFFTEPFLTNAPSKRKEDGSQFVYNMQEWVAREGESVIELHTLITKPIDGVRYQWGRPVDSPLVSSETLEQIKSFTNYEMKNWLLAVAGKIGSAFRCLIDVNIEFRDLHSRNVMLCYKGDVRLPEDIRVVFVDVSAFEEIDNTQKQRQLANGWPNAVGMLSEMELRHSNDDNVRNLYREFIRRISKAFSPKEAHEKWQRINGYQTYYPE